MKSFWCCALYILTCTTADAIDQPGIIGEDNREIIDNSAAPWSAIGQINVSGLNTVSFCSGTLIAPDRVLTAAHCLVNARRKQPFLPDQIHFVAGANRGAFKGHSIAKCTLLHPNFDVSALKSNPDLYKLELPIDRVATDLGVIVLQEPLAIAGTILPSTTPLVAGDTVTLAGFHADKRQVLAGHRGCKVLAAQGDVLAVDCDVRSGSSGGPLLIEREGTLSIVGVMSAAGIGANAAVAFSAASDLLEAECPLDDVAE
jgi:protease YdgD